jgi:hypothetical protein
MAAAMRRKTFLTSMIGIAATYGVYPMQAQTEPDTVDVLLVLAVDVLPSIDDDEARLQRPWLSQCDCRPAGGPGDPRRNAGREQPRLCPT